MSLMFTTRDRTRGIACGLIALLWGGSGLALAQSETSTDAASAWDASEAGASRAETQWLEAETEPQPASLTLYFENDGSFVGPRSNSDRHYTSGQGLSVAWHENGGNDIADALNLPSDGTAVGLTLVQQIFTPDGIGDVVLDPDDRPYAGFLFLGGFWQREYQDVFDHVQLDIGVVGPSSLGEQAQEWIHDLIDDTDPNWIDQLGDEFAFNLTLRRKWRLDLWEQAVAGESSSFSPQTWGLQLIPEVGVDVGNVYRRANAGGTLRFGFNLPDDFGPPRLMDPGSATGGPVEGLSTYVFARGLGRYVEWNTFIEGSNERDPSQSVSLQPWVGEIGGGFAVDWRRGNWSLSAAYQQTYLSQEFEEQTTDDSFGSIALRARYEF